MLLLCLGLLGLILSGCEGPLLSQLAVPTLGEKKKTRKANLGERVHRRNFFLEHLVN